MGINKLELAVAALLIGGGWWLSRGDAKQFTVNAQSNARYSVPTEVWTLAKPAYDGDTLTVTRGAEQVKVRFACVDAPELKQPMGEQARNYLRSLIVSANNQVSIKVVDSDRYGRKVSVVYAGGEILQEKLAGQGLAMVYSQYLNNCPQPERDRIVAAEQSARTARRGMWASANPQTPWDYRRQKR
ncbi:MAG TPA: thermonuclease family protein [Candidatus Obscuribacterales bacterium]